MLELVKIKKADVFRYIQTTRDFTQLSLFSRHVTSVGVEI